MAARRLASITDAKVALLCGGWSSEREVSLESGKECARALVDEGFGHVDVLDVADGSFVRTMAEGDYDVAFPALHGRYGEDGCVQGFLEMLGIPYAFSGVLASAVAFDKAMAKDVFMAHHIPTPAYVGIEEGEVADVDAIVRELGLPLFVKPARNGSSYGITKVRVPAELAGAVELARGFGGRVIVERFVEGTEITVPVIGNDSLTALPPIEIAFDTEFYDSSVKYEDPSHHHVVPPRLPAPVLERASDLACRAHKALDCSGASRSDFIVTDGGVPYLLETNVIPGMTPASLLPDSARHAGVGFGALCRRLIELALERGARERS